MSKELKDIDIKVIKFLLSAGVYSDLAIVKNLGITYEELEESYTRLLKKGYLESYEEYKKREQEDCHSGSNCGECSKNDGTCGACCSNNKQEYSDVKVITWKAIDRFQE